MDKKILDELAERLRGTTLSVEEVAEEMGFDAGDLSYEDWCYIEGITFQCSGCGWWWESPSWDGFCLDCWVEQEEFYDRVEKEEQENY